MLNSMKTTPALNDAPAAVVVFSGGLDSLVLLHWCAKNLWRHGSYKPLALCFNYGQRAAVERDHGRRIAASLNVPFEVVDISRMNRLFGSSSLTSDNPELHGKSTVVPNRNAIFINIAAAACDAMGGGIVLYGAHKSTAGIYPDTTPEFVEATDEAIMQGTGGKVRLQAPLISYTKAEVVKLGANLGVPFETSWSCYENGSHHCGHCYACQDRRSAFEKAGVKDPTLYASDFPESYWRMLWAGAQRWW